MFKLTADQKANQAVTISVSENMDKIFIPFYSTKGSGIGLSLSRQIMKLHRGRIDVETEPGAGTTFILEI